MRVVRGAYLAPGVVVTGDVVLGVGTNADGSRNYLATPTPYVVSGHDFSTVPFPAWPQGLVPTPRDVGYSALSSTDKATEDTIRKGPSSCAVCHGDPDGDGPLTEPAQGDLHQTQPTRNACGFSSPASAMPSAGCP